MGLHRGCLLGQLSSKLSDKQQKQLRRMHDTGKYSINDLAKLFTVSLPTVYWIFRREQRAI